ncbi:MAG: hypothetical protein DRP20_04540 [Thermotogae bacterium]|nr:MAG: hypothetical protein DRP20_04540 [Thermotogota bacterium]
MRLKKLSVLIVLFLLINLVFGDQVEIKDVSPVLDVYKAVSFLVENQIMKVDENGNFKGGLLITRFDMAEYLYNLINVFNLHLLASNMSSVTQQTQEISVRIKGIEAAYTSIEDRLNNYAALLRDVQMKMDQISADVSSQIKNEVETQTSFLQSSVEELSQKISSLEEDFLQREDRIASLQDKISSLESTSTDLKDSIENLKERVNDLNTQDTQLSELLKEFDAKIQAQEDFYNKKIEQMKSDTEANIKSVQNDLALYRKEVNDYTLRIEKLEMTASQMSRDFEDALQALATEEQFLTLESSVTLLSKQLVSNREKISNIEQKVSSINNEYVMRRLQELESSYNKMQQNMWTAYLIGGAGVALGLLGLFFAMGSMGGM